MVRRKQQPLPSAFGLGAEEAGNAAAENGDRPSAHETASPEKSRAREQTHTARGRWCSPGSARGSGSTATSARPPRQPRHCRRPPSAPAAAPRRPRGTPAGLARQAGRPWGSRAAVSTPAAPSARRGSSAAPGCSARRRPAWRPSRDGCGRTAGAERWCSLVSATTQPPTGTAAHGERASKHAAARLRRLTWTCGRSARTRSPRKAEPTALASVGRKRKRFSGSSSSPSCLGSRGPPSEAACRGRGIDFASHAAATAPASSPSSSRLFIP